jgi:nuclease HARBI1
MIDLVQMFGRSKDAISRIFNYMLDHIYVNFRRVLTWDHERLTPALLENFATAITSKGSPLNNCIGFIDGTVRPISRPTKYQRIIYNGARIEISSSGVAR